MRVRKRIVKVAVTLVVVASVAFPSFKWIEAKNEARIQSEQAAIRAEQQLILDDARARYVGDSVLGITKTEKVFLAFRKQEDNSVLASLFIDGLWVELGEVGEMK